MRWKIGKHSLPGGWAPKFEALERRLCLSVNPALVGQVPPYFERNVGQTNAIVDYLSKGPNDELFLTADQAVLELDAGATFSPTNAAVLRLGFPGANPAPSVSGLDPLATHTQYFIGDNPNDWFPNVPTFGAVQYSNLYPGVDLTFHPSSSRQLEYDFTVSPGSNPKTISLNFNGASQLAIDSKGDLVIKIGASTVIQPAPTIYQTIGSGRMLVSGRYVLQGGNCVGFQVGHYDATRPLVIDPVLVYSTYIGGTGPNFQGGVEEVSAAAVGPDGSLYVTGITASNDFPTTAGSFDPTNTVQNDNDVFVAKLDPTGSTLEYSTYLGGSSDFEWGFGIAVDSSGAAYVAGYTRSTDFPTTTGAFQTTHDADADAFITKLNPSGSALEYSTLLGGNNYDEITSIVVDSKGDAYVAGDTQSVDFPVTSNALQTTFDGGGDAFVAELNPAGSNLLYSTYLGGSGFDKAFGIAIDGNGNAYIAGETQSSDFPVVNALQSTFGGGAEDAFLTKISAGGSSLVLSTYIGGAGDDAAMAIALDGSGQIHITGTTTSDNFPTVNAFQDTYGSDGDAFVGTISSAGTAVSLSYLGGSGNDTGTGIATDSAGNVYVTGSTNSPDFPTLDSLQGPGGGDDAFLLKLDSSGTTPVYNTLLGGSADDLAQAVAVDSNGDAYIVGQTFSLDFPTHSPFQPVNRGGEHEDCFIAKVADPTGVQIVNVAPATGGNTGLVTLRVTGSEFSSSVLSAQLSGPTGTDLPAIAATAIAMSSHDLLTAQFDLTGAVPGYRDLSVVFSNGTSTTLSNAYLIESGAAAAPIVANVIGRNVIRPGAPQTFTITYVNTGDVDADAPLLVVNASSGLSLGLAGSNALQPSPLLLFAPGTAASAGRLSPGETYAINITVQAASNLPLGDSETLSVGVLDTTEQPFDWAAFAASVPAELTASDWESRVQQAQQSIGSSWDDILGFFRNQAAQASDPSVLNDYASNLRFAVYGYGASGAAQNPNVVAPSTTSIESSVNQAAAGPLPTFINTINAGNANATRSFVLFAGYGPTPTYVSNLAMAIAQKFPDDPVYIADWSALSGGNMGWLTAPGNFNTAATDLFSQLAAFLDPSNTTFIMTSYGVNVGSQVAQDFGQVDEGIALDPGNSLFSHVIPDLTQPFGESISARSSSLFDIQTNERANYDLTILSSAHDSGFVALTNALNNDQTGLLIPNFPFQNGESISVNGIISPPSGLTTSPFDTGFPSTFPFTGPAGTDGLTTVGGIDPNDETGVSGVGDDRYVQGGSSLQYVVDFENLPTATAPASQVVVSDQLNPSELDGATFQFGPIDFGDTQLLPPANATDFTENVDLRPVQDLIVEVHAHFDPITGLTTWTFTSVDPATGLPPSNPLLGFLPPDEQPPDGEGSVLFSITANENLSTGTQISNNAVVTFDSNPPISTPTWLNTIDASAPYSQVSPLPAIEPASEFPVSWSGSDDGSGIQDYSIFVSDNGGAFTPWLQNTILTNSVYAGTAGQTYAFYGIAADNTGNVQLTPDAAQATTSTGSPLFTGSIIGTAASVLAGNKGTAIVRMSNNENSAINGKYALTLVIRASSTTVNSTNFTLAMSQLHLKLKPGQSATRRLRFTYPQTLGNGSYDLMASVSTGGVPVSVIAGATVQIAPAVVDLAPTIVTLPENLVTGYPARLSIAVSNSGNVAANGPLTVEVLASTSQSASGAQLLTQIMTNISLKPNKVRRYFIGFSPPVSLAAGSYYLIAQLIPGTQIPDSDVADKLVYSAVQVALNP